MSDEGDLNKIHMKLIFHLREYRLHDFRNVITFINIDIFYISYIEALSCNLSISAPTVFVEFVISAYQIFQAQNLLGLPSKENPLELDENIIRQYFSQAQIRVH